MLQKKSAYLPYPLSYLLHFLKSTLSGFFVSLPSPYRALSSLLFIKYSAQCCVIHHEKKARSHDLSSSRYLLRTMYKSNAWLARKNSSCAWEKKEMQNACADTAPTYINIKRLQTPREENTKRRFARRNSRGRFPARYQYPIPCARKGTIQNAHSHLLLANARPDCPCWTTEISPDAV